MTALATLTRMINERQRDIAELQAELDVLRVMETKRHGNGEAKVSLPPPRGARQAMLRKIMKDAGREGLTRPEIIERMSAVCDSSSGSISGMLSLLANKGQVIRTERGRWRVKYAR